VNAQDSKAEIFDVFMCHNSEDKRAVREIARKLSEEHIKPWLDEADIRSGSFWHTAIGQQIETVKSAAVFVGESGVGPWQHREIIALLDQFDKRECPVIPVILASVSSSLFLPWSLAGLHCVDFRAADSHPLKRLIWGITGQKPAELSDVPSSEKPATMREATKSRLVPGKDEYAASDKVISEARLYPPLAEPPDRDNATQLKILRSRVTEYWVDGLLKHSLYNEVLISLGKRQIDKAVDAPWKYTVEVFGATNSAALDDREVSAIYDATGLLLILGEPGSGKTTTLLDLARTLLERARNDIKERVPIVLNLSSWNKGQGLTEWMSGELSEKYRVPRKIARSWIQRNHLLPLLDGLDEVETDIQPDCVAAINEFIDESNPSGLVVCCRLNEYRWLPERLKLNGAIRLEPLSEDEVARYLVSGGPQLRALREAVNRDPVLQELAQTPLMLSIMSLASQGTGGNELAKQSGDSPEERRKQIFHLYVEQMFQRKGRASLVFPKEKTIGWLSWLAGKMRKHSQSEFLVEGLQPTWLGPWDERGGYASAVALSLAAIFALICALTGRLIGVLTGGPIDGLIWGLIVGLIVGLSNGLRLGLGTGLLSGPMFGLISGLIVGVIVGPICGLSYGLSNGLTVGLVSGLLSGLVSGLILGPISGVKVRCFGLISGLIVGVIVGPICGLSYGLSNGLTVGLVSGLLSGLVSGLILGPVSRTVLPFFVYADSLFSLRSISAEEILENLKLLENLSWRVQHDHVAPPDCVQAGKAFPNQGIKLSLKNSLVVFVVIGLLGWLLGGLMFGLGYGLIAGLGDGLSAGLILGLYFALGRGGSAVIMHYALRLILWRKGYTPFNFVKFLDQCARLILLKKAGGGYIFIHRMLSLIILVPRDFEDDLSGQDGK
jgi:eukaryotic-like serine/threonine-protein kinase